MILGRIPRKKESVIPLTLAVVFMLSGCVFLDIDMVEIPKLNIQEVDFDRDIRSDPYGNLSRADVATIPVLVTAIDEALTSSSPNQLSYTITREEWDQILQLLIEKNIASFTGGGMWYIAFEGTFLMIYLYHEVS